MPSLDMKKKDGASNLLIGCFFPRNLTQEGIGTFISGLVGSMSEYGWDVTVVLPAGSQLNMPNKCFSKQIISYDPGITAIWSYSHIIAQEYFRFDKILLVENNPNFLKLFSKISGISLTDPNVYSYLYTPLLTVLSIRDFRWRFQGILHLVAKWRLWAQISKWSDIRIIVSTNYQRRQLQELGADCVSVVKASIVDTLHKKIPDSNVKYFKNEIFTVGYVGHFSPAKGIDVLLDAFDNSLKKNNLRLAIAYSNKGRLSLRYRKLLNKLILAQYAQMFSTVNSVHFLSTCDVTVLPYPSKSVHHIPLVMLESMAAGTPIITTAVGGISEIVHDGYNGFVVEPRNPEQLSEKILWMAKHPNKTAAMGVAAKEYFEKFLSRDLFCHDINNILNKG